jgi:hypothetical protein
MNFAKVRDQMLLSKGGTIRQGARKKFRAQAGGKGRREGKKTARGGDGAVEQRRQSARAQFSGAPLRVRARLHVLHSWAPCRTRGVQGQGAPQKSMRTSPHHHWRKKNEQKSGTKNQHSD